MKLYYIPTTRAVRPRWLLEEMGITCKLVQVDMKITQEPEYQNLHPHQKVPVLIDGEVTIFESTAICTYLADKYPNFGLAPAIDSPERAYYYQWLFYASVTLEAPVEHFMFAVLPHLPEKILPTKVREAISSQEALQWFNKVAEPLRNVLVNSDYLVGNQFSTADIITGGVLLWAKKLGMLDLNDPLSNYLDNLIRRPAFTRADEDFYAKIPTAL
ncbi:glutathione S-transferase, putative (plasmid) [Calothrix sp. PCC 7716]|nr:glutathione S-transferase, putative [Calothrix sp. PCC 7716]